MQQRLSVGPVSQQKALIKYGTVALICKTVVTGVKHGGFLHFLCHKLFRTNIAQHRVNRGSD